MAVTVKQWIIPTCSITVMLLISFTHGSDNKPLATAYKGHCNQPDNALKNCNKSWIWFDDCPCPIRCSYCKGHQREDSRLYCYSKMHEDKHCDSCLEHIFQCLPANTTDLEIVINNKWNGHLPFYVPPQNMSGISRIKSLRRFKLQQQDFSYSQPFQLIFNGDSFKGLRNLSEVEIQIPLVDMSLKEMIRPLTSLEALNLSYTRGLSLKSIFATLSGLSSKLKYLCLRTFQLIGGDGYSPVLNTTDMIEKTAGMLSELQEIDLSDNSLARITPGVSELAPRLQKFDISGNVLLDSHNVPIIIESILHPTMYEFNVGYQGYIGGGLPKSTKRQSLSNYFRPDDFVTTEIQHPEDYNSQSIFDPFKGFNPFIISCFNLKSDGNITNLLDDNERFCAVAQCLAPVQFNGIPCKLFPNVSEIFDISCHLFLRIPIGRNLRELLFTHIHWEESATTGVQFKHAFCAANNSLKSFIFSANSDWIHAGKINIDISQITQIRGLEHLTDIVLSKNNITANISFLSTGAYFMNLRRLDLSENFFSFQDSFQFCRKMHKLEHILLKSNNLTNLPEGLVQNCSRLEILSLQGNKLSSNDVAVLNFTGTVRLKSLNLGQNNIKTLGKNFINNLNIVQRHSNISIQLDLSGNPLLCDCKSLDFILWLQTSNDFRFKNYETYTCSGRGGVQFVHLVDVNQMRKECFPSQLLMILISVLSTAGTMLSMIIFLFIYKYRWRIRYKAFALKQFLTTCCCQNSDSLPNGFKYDAFVSYSADDRFWVHDVLMKELENTYGFHLCIHYRDFPVGGCIYETVSEHMSTSRHIIIILSDITMRSNMCQFEIDEAQRQAVQNQKSLLFIKLGYLTPPIPNARVAYLLDRHTYLEWTENKKTHKLFWAKLVGHLYDDLKGSCCSCCCAYGTRAIGYQEIVDPNLDLMPESE